MCKNRGKIKNIYNEEELFMANTKVVIADDNERMVSLLEEILREDKDIEVVGVADNGVDAVKVIKTSKIGRASCRERV